jgi:hypothetical protein
MFKGCLDLFAFSAYVIFGAEGSSSQPLAVRLCTFGEVTRFGVVGLGVSLCLLCSVIFEEVCTRVLLLLVCPPSSSELCDDSSEM